MPTTSARTSSDLVDRSLSRGGDGRRNGIALTFSVKECFARLRNERLPNGILPVTRQYLIDVMQIGTQRFKLSEAIPVSRFPKTKCRDIPWYFGEPIMIKY
jgi:hypothetical protein